MQMTNEQKEKIIELRKLGIGYRSIAVLANFKWPEYDGVVCP